MPPLGPPIVDQSREPVKLVSSGDETASGPVKRMQVNDWLRRLDELLGATADSDGEPSSLRNLTFGVFRLLESGDIAVQDAFQALTETEISADAKLDGEALSAAAYRPPSTPTDVPAGVRVAACLLRGLEAALTGLGSHAWGRPRASSFRASFGNEQGWILPYAPRFRLPFSAAQPYFRKRGLQHHRCLSERLQDGMHIDLHIIDTGFDEPIAAACCLFSGVSLIGADGAPIAADGGPFEVHGLKGRGDDEVAEALAGACSATDRPSLVLFPELTVRPEDRQEIQTLLRTAPWDPDLSGHRPRLVFAGSWHDVIAEGPEAGRRQNIAPIYDGNGVAIARHIKHEPYLGSGLREDIVVGDRIVVLASRSLTVAVAICLDFCQEARPNTYEHVDADLVVVVSFGNQTTTEAHDRRSQMLWNGRKTGTVLVQQNDSSAFGVSGALPDTKPFAREAATAVTVRKISSAG